MNTPNTGDRIAFFESFASREYHLALEAEPDEGHLDPMVFDTSDGAFALAFDTEELLADFTGGGTHATLPGRVLAAILAPKNLGLCLNPDTDPILLGPDDLDWLIDLLGHTPLESTGNLTDIAPPGPLPRGMKQALVRRIEAAPGLASKAVIANANGNPIIAILDAHDRARPALAGSLQEALIFSGVSTDWAIAFLGSETEVAKDLIAAGTVIEFPQVKEAKDAERPAPGSDPDNPPILR